MRFLVILAIIFPYGKAIAQDRIIQSGSPFLLISPDARSIGMGNTGASNNSDFSSTYWNAGKLPFTKVLAGVGIGYTAFMPAQNGTTRQLWFSGYQKVEDNHVLAFSLKHFKYGEIVIRDENGYETGPGITVNPSDFTISVTYSKKLGDGTAIGISPAYVYSGIAKGLSIEGEIKGAGHAVAINMGLYGEMQTTRMRYGYGITLNNIGSKISYGMERLKEFLPMNIRFGGSGRFIAGAQSSISLVLEATKLLLPSPPVLDSKGNIIKGQNTDKSVTHAIFTSFTDAPGGVKEELKEIMTSFGMEYEYEEKFFARTGVAYEAKSKGDNRYSTLGVGLRRQNLLFDVSYLQPLSATNSKNNTISLGLSLLIE